MGVGEAVVGAPHGGAQEEPALPQGEEVGALQDAPQRRRGELVGVGPAETVPAAVEEDPARAVPGASQEHAVAPAVPPHPGVPGVLPVPQGGVGEDGEDLALVPPVVEVPAVGGGHQGLAGLEPVPGGQVDVLAVGLEVAHGGVVEAQGAVRLQGGPRKDSILVVVLGGEEGHPQVLPVDQIGAHGVAPVHGPPPGGVGEVLVEEVVFPFIIDKAVGVVEPVARRTQM